MSRLRMLGRAILRRPAAAAFAVAVLVAAGFMPSARAGDAPEPNWIGTWSAAPQPFMPGDLDRYKNQTLRLIVRVSLGGERARIRLSNLFGDRPLTIGAAHLARGTSGADVDAATDRALTFNGQAGITLAPGASAVSDAIDLTLPPLSDVAVSLYLPQATAATTSHYLASQTSYVSTAGNAAAAAKFPSARSITSWPFLSGVEVVGSPHAASLVAFGTSIVDGDGSTPDANRRWPDLLAQRLHAAGREIGVLNQGLIGNRLLRDSPARSQFGAALGQAGVKRFTRDVLGQAGVRYLIVLFGGNDLSFPGGFAPASDKVTAAEMISGFRQLITAARLKGIRVIGTTMMPNAAIAKADPATPWRNEVRQAVNAWIRDSGEFDAVLDFDAILRDPERPTQLRAEYDSGDHTHPNDAGYAAVAEAIPLSLFAPPAAVSPTSVDPNPPAHR